MKKNKYSLIKNISLLVAGFLFAGTADAQYCTFTSPLGCSSGHGISKVETSGGINNFNNSSNCSPNYYGDYTGTSMKVTQEASKTVDVKVTFSSGAPAAHKSYTKVYVDWNQNDTFEANANPPEYIVPQLTTDHAHQNPGTTITVNITVPGLAKAGMTRMRVVTASQGSIWTPPANFNSCVAPSRGEAEDYNFEVINPCIKPDVISTANIDFESADVSWTSKANARLYEYIIKRTPDTPTSNGYSYTTINGVDVDTLACDVKYYVFVRTICDTTGISSNWDVSSWAVDSFTTEPCCYAPMVNLQTGSLTSTTAQFSWQPIQTAYGYEYAVSTLENTPPQRGTFTTQTGIFIQGLSSRKKYCLWVRALCSPTPESSWSKVCFKTAPGLDVENISGQQPLLINVYPNPVANKLNVQLDGYIGDNARVSLSNVTGQVVYQGAVSGDNFEINTSDLTAGIYILKYEDDNRTQVQKIMKQ